MNKLIIILSCLLLQSKNIHADFQDAFIDGSIGAIFLAVSTYSASETLLDCGHRYHELKKEYIHYLQELKELDRERIMTDREKRFWALNQAVSKFPKVFWRELVSGSFSLFTGVLGFKFLKKSLFS